MASWWTYGLSDLLLFSAPTYYRLLERYNQEVWPAQVPAQMLGLAILGLLWHRPPWQGRAVNAILCTGWLWVAWAYHLQRYATINWTAPWFAAGFACQAVLLLWSGLDRHQPGYRLSATAPSAAGLVMFLVALVVQPLFAPIWGRGWPQAEWFGISADPTAVATLGVLLMTDGPIRWTLTVIPILWCLISGAVLWSLDAPEALAAPLVVLAVVVLAAGKHRQER